MGTLKGVGRIYQQPFVDTYSKVAFAKLHERQSALTAADLLNDQVVPFFEEHEVPLSQILTDRGTEYCGNPDSHEYELYLAVENIDHTRTKVKSPQTNGIVERLHKTMLNEFYRITFRKKIYTTLAELQADLDEWLRYYNEERLHVEDGHFYSPDNEDIYDNLSDQVLTFTLEKARFPRIKGDSW